VKRPQESRKKLQVATPDKRSFSQLALPAFLIALPAVLFTGITLRFLVNIPIWDDYHALLSFTSILVQKKGIAARLLHLLASQHGEYKLFFEHGIAWAEVALTGHLNFEFLGLLGNSAVLILALILWSMFLPKEKDLARRLTFFVPVSWLLFQLQYWESVDWAMEGLENLWVIVFALGAIGLLLRPSSRAFAGAVVLYVLAIGTNGNGLVMLPVGLLILVTRRRFAGALSWLTVSTVCIAAYAFQYNFQASPSNGTLFNSLSRVDPFYAIAFVGSAGAIAGESYASLLLSLMLALSLLGLFGWLARRECGKRNPFVSFCVLFFLLTALGVAGIRSDLGLRSSVTSRYTVYGVLFVIMAWAAISEEFLQKQRERLVKNKLLWTATILSVMFSLSMDVYGYLNLAQRKDAVVQDMAVFEHSHAGALDEPMLTSPDESPDATGLSESDRDVLIESIRLGIYEPPKL
jgi:hypothetical protein